MLAGRTIRRTYRQSTLLLQSPTMRNRKCVSSPAESIGTRIISIIGQPNPKHISTSYVERQNLTMRMQMRLTNGFSKKIENHAHAVALHYMDYNFCRVHQTLRITPAMEAGITDHVWNLDELVGLLDRMQTEAVA